MFRALLLIVEPKPFGNQFEAQPETDGREGLKSLELLIATYLAARDGRRVTLPLEY